MMSELCNLTRASDVMPCSKYSYYSTCHLATNFVRGYKGRGGTALTGGHGPWPTLRTATE